MKRGEVWWVKFNTPSVGGEIEKQRPAVIISNDAAKQASEPSASRSAYIER